MIHTALFASYAHTHELHFAIVYIYICSMNRESFICAKSVVVCAMCVCMCHIIITGFLLSSSSSSALTAFSNLHFYLIC